MSRYYRHNIAKDLHLKSFTGMKKTLGPTHLLTLQAQEHLALCYLYLGNLELAHGLAAEVLEVRERKCGREHPYRLMAVLMIARIKTAQGEYEEGENLIRAGLPIAERNLGNNHLGVLLARVWLSQALVKQKRYVEAEEILISVVERHRYEGSQREDGEHTDRIQALWFLLNCYEIQGKIEQAISIGDEVWEAVQNIGGEALGLQHVFTRRFMAKREDLKAKKSAATHKVVYDHEKRPGYDESERATKGLMRSMTKSRTF